MHVKRVQKGIWIYFNNITASIQSSLQRCSGLCYKTATKFKKMQKTIIDESFKKLPFDEFEKILKRDQRPNKHGFRENQFEIWLLTQEVVYIVKYLNSYSKEYFVKIQK